jgi:hypothetical protein
MGRRNKYLTNIEPNMEMIVGYLNSGHTEASVAARFGVGVSTWERYKSEHEEFREAIRQAGMNATALVVNSLFKRAKGYEFEETQVIFDAPQKDKDGKLRNPIREIRKTTKHIAPDTAAIIFWVINRDPEHWKNSQYINHSGEIQNNGVLLTAPPMDKEEWLQFYKKNVEEKHQAKRP